MACKSEVDQMNIIRDHAVIVNMHLDEANGLQKCEYCKALIADCLPTINLRDNNYLIPVHVECGGIWLKRVKALICVNEITGKGNLHVQDLHNVFRVLNEVLARSYGGSSSSSNGDDSPSRLELLTRLRDHDPSQFQYELVKDVDDINRDVLQAAPGSKRKRVLSTSSEARREFNRLEMFSLVAEGIKNQATHTERFETWSRVFKQNFDGDIKCWMLLMMPDLIVDNDGNRLLKISDQDMVKIMADAFDVDRDKVFALVAEEAEHGRPLPLTLAQLFAENDRIWPKKTSTITIQKAEAFLIHFCGLYQRLKAHELRLSELVTDVTFSNAAQKSDPSKSSAIDHMSGSEDADRSSDTSSCRSKFDIHDYMKDLIQDIEETDNGSTMASDDDLTSDDQCRQARRANRKVTRCWHSLVTMFKNMCSMCSPPDLHAIIRLVQFDGHRGFLGIERDLFILGLDHQHSMMMAYELLDDRSDCVDILSRALIIRRANEGKSH